jgi:hypothetical protein
MRLLCCLLLLPGLATAEIYRWTDANGQVHFDQRPAAAGAAPVEVKPQVVERDQLTRERQERAERFYQARREEQAQAQAAAAQSQAERAAECRQLRSQLADIAEGPSYYQVGADGQRDYYSDEQLDTARQRLRDRMSERCS